MESKKDAIGVLTYDISHRKTYDTLCLLKASGYTDVYVYALPLQYKKIFRPIYEHRPQMLFAVDMSQMCSFFDYRYQRIESYDELMECGINLFLVCGAGLLPDWLIKKYRVINAHPGYIPNCRGLDAFKWAIIEKQPIGVTSHLIGDAVDAGNIILRREIPVYKNDTFHEAARRVYENEVQILVDSIEKINSVEQFLTYSDGEDYIVHKRMPKEIEKGLLTSFEEYKESYGI